MNLTELTIRQTHEGLKKKQFSALEICRAYLDKIAKEDKKINAFLTVTRESALLQAKKIDEMILSGQEISLLAGIPLAIKDNILVKNVRCTAGSKILDNYIAPYDATVIKKLQERGAVILGKTNLDEFAMGASGENSAFGPTRNPHDLSRVPGGSSAGSVAAVAANMSCGALGSDTGGSIRQPASLSGVVGLKPTYGAVSRYGLIALVCSFDQIGPITKTIEDAKILFEAISGKDPLDSTSLEFKFQSSLPNFQIKEVCFGVPKEYFIEGIDPKVEEIIQKAIKKYEDLGAKIEEISLPHTKYAIATYYIITPSEVSANLARYDGIKYGYSTIQSKKSKLKSLLNVYLESRGEGFGEEVRRRIMLGTYALSAGYYDAYYLKAQKFRTLIKEDFKKAFQKVDFILTPTSPTPAFKLGEKTEDPLKMYLCDIFTSPVNLAGLPGISIPAGKKGNLPVGLQIIGKPFEEDKILQVAQTFETI
ncbi:glutamyl-tRNA amidotransferase [Parcubacteria bacterium DG_74_3]|nr:MAG: glutamyl-tRNA amidotransferase [Parcubacteria bacterium DG_74_3]